MALNAPVVGSGSSAQLLRGSARTAATISSTVTDWNWLNNAAEGFDEKEGGGAASDVVHRTPTTLSSKIWWKCEALTLVGDGDLPRPSRASIDRHSWRSSDFRRRRARYSWRLEFHAVVACDVFRWRYDLSSRLTSRFECRHLLSNQGSD